MCEESITCSLSSGTSDFTPSLEFELTRRQVEKGVQEMWWYTYDQLRQLRKKVETFSEATSQIDQVMEDGLDHTRYKIGLHILLFLCLLC